VLRVFGSLTGPSAEGQRDRATTKDTHQRNEDLFCSGGRYEFCVHGRKHIRNRHKREIDAARVMDSRLEEIRRSPD
jgi:hypothetical protein